MHTEAGQLPFTKACLLRLEAVCLIRHVEVDVIFVIRRKILCADKDNCIIFEEGCVWNQTEI